MPTVEMRGIVKRFGSLTANDHIDFTVEEAIEIDRENSPWPKSVSEQNELWRRRLKAAVLSQKLSDKELDKIAETLTKRYKNRLKQAVQKQKVEQQGKGKKEVKGNSFLNLI